MKRLNAMLSVLANSEDREAYDRTLSLAPEPWRGAFHPLVRRPPPWLWPVAGAVMCVGLVSVLTRAPKPVPTPVAVASTAAAQPEPAPERRQRPARDQRGAARRAKASATPTADPSPEIDPPKETEPREEIAGAAPAPLARQSPAPSEAKVGDGPDWVGEWLFLPSSSTRTNGLYPPEYIELHLTEDGGILHGRYRARYRVTDRAISPLVAFQFEGRMGSDGACLPWNGTGGARGEIALHLRNDGTLEVRWVAHQIGDEMGLISGTATLVRKLD